MTLLKGMYVRCSIDLENTDEPRDFIIGKIESINDFSETAIVSFYDNNNIKGYYNVPNEMTVYLHSIVHCKILLDSEVIYLGETYRIIECDLDKNDKFYYYYIKSSENKVIKVCEDKIEATFNLSEISPLNQIKKYEFQNPLWYFGRGLVNKTVRTIDNSFYGFKELAGCKIYLKPYQLKTVMRCLSEKNCRYMIADEVGLGKTIEAASVIKVFLSDKKNQKVLIVVPDALREQWITELAFKFKLFNGVNQNNNVIKVLPVSLLMTVDKSYDFVVVDEVHRIIGNKEKYLKTLSISQSSKNVIMLSATPVQSRSSEFHKLLTLIQPEKYSLMPIEDFQNLLDLQSKIIRKIHTTIECLDDYKESIEESDGCITEDVVDTFTAVVDELEDIANKTSDELILRDINNLVCEEGNLSLEKIEKIIAYVCEAYQLEKCVIRNRRVNNVNSNIRQLCELPYIMDSDLNNTEYRVYTLLSEWLENTEVDKNKFVDIISAFFSSSMAFNAQVTRLGLNLSTELIELVEKWIKEENSIGDNIRNHLDNLEDEKSRMITIFDYIDQEAYDKKVLVFTHFKETFDLYKNAFIGFLGEKSCAFFSKDMNSIQLESNTYKFQTEESCQVMLSDETGGEGRNFQNADVIINIDLPWSANTIEQRIGRLDRIGRDENKSVVSVVAFAEDSVEKDLLNIWSKGLGVFNKSQSGLEIIMNDIDEKIQLVALKDLKYGLSSIIDEVIEEIKVLEKRVKEERHFDITAYKYQIISNQIERIVSRYSEKETDLFSDAMMSWTSLSGFNANKIDDNVVRFSVASFSPRSAYKTMLVPPDMKRVTETKLNLMQNRIRELNGDKTIKLNPNMIQGTFNRARSIENDYLHFFAPGDEIFDCITGNAVNSYKGKSAAFALMTTFNWDGFVFNWYMKPNELILLENGISPKNINKYRGFLNSDVVSVFISKEDIFDDELDNATKEYSKLFSFQNVRDTCNNVANYGKRTPSRDFLNNKSTYGISNMSWFKEFYSESVWKEIVDNAYTKSKVKAKEQFSKKRKLQALKDTMSRSISAEQASIEYFGENIDVDKIIERNKIVLEAFKNPKFVLDSICYIRMIKDE